MTSKPMVVFQRKSLHLSLLCKALVRLDYFCLLFSFYLKRYKYFFSILLSHCFRHWDGYITTTDKLKWLVWGYRYIGEQKGWWLKGENCFKLFIELLFLSLGIWEQLKKKKWWMKMNTVWAIWWCQIQHYCHVYFHLLITQFRSFKIVYFFLFECGM